MSASASSVDVVGDFHVFASTADEAAFVSPFFIRRNLEHLGKDDGYLSPIIVQKLADAFKKDRFLILGGRFDGQLTYLLPHIAIALQVTLARAGNGVHAHQFIEYQARSDDTFYDLASELSRLGPSIVLFPSANRQNIGYSFPEVQKAATAGNHYVLCVSESHDGLWRFTPTEKLCWLDLAAETLLDPTYLVECLCRGLILQQENLLPHLQGKLEPEHELLPGMAVREIALHLSSERAITVFIQLLGTVRERTTEAELKSLLDIASRTDDQAIKRWYYHGLSSREQLLALAVSFFDGLSEDQVFAALQELVLNVWQQQEAGRSIFDYIELEKLRAFYLFTRSDPSRARIKGALPRQRLTLLSYAWDSYRMHIRKALPWLIRLVKESVTPGANGELLGSYKQGAELRQAIGETISDIGLISIESTEDALLWLVADSRPAVQTVAARALGQWYAAGKRSDFFAVLSRWEEPRSRTLIAEVLNNPAPNIQEAINCATALGLTFAAMSDAPDQTDPRIVARLADLVERGGRRLLRRFQLYTVPKLMPLHLHQLRDVFKRMIIYEELHDKLSQTLVEMYVKQMRQHDVLRTIAGWAASAIKVKPESSHNERNLTLAFVTRVLLRLWYEEDLQQPRSEQILARVADLITREYIPQVHIACLETVLQYPNQGPTRFVLVEPLLQEIAETLDDDQRVKAVRVIFKLYEKQRKELEGGDAIFELGHVKYATWIDQARPSVFSEFVLYRWVTNDSHRPLQELGLQAAIAIAHGFELAEAEFRNREFHRRRAAEWDRRATERTTLAGPRARKLFEPRVVLTWFKGFFDSFLFWLACIPVRTFRVAIRGILPEAEAQFHIYRPEFQYLLRKWRQVFDYRHIPLFSKELQRAIWVVARRRLIAFLLIFIVVFGLLTLLVRQYL